MTTLYLLCTALMAPISIGVFFGVATIAEPERVSGRLLAVWFLLISKAALLFQLLAYTSFLNPTGLASLWIMIDVLMLGYVTTRTSLVDVWTFLKRDLRATQNCFRKLPLVFWLVVFLLAFQFFRSLHVPPLAWDDLTYHLPRAVFWVKAGGLEVYDAPGAWEYYRWFPFLGDSLQTLGVLSTGSDVLLGPIGLFQWIGIVVAGFIVANEISDRASLALQSSLVGASLPAISAHIFTGYVDNLVAGLTLASIAGVLLSRKAQQPRFWLSLAAISGVICVGLKPTGVPIVGGILCFGLYQAYRAHIWPWILLCMVLAFGVFLAPNMVLLWQETGSPFFPFKVFSFPYSAELARLNSVPPLRNPYEYLLGLFSGGYHASHAHRNLGLAGLLLLPTLPLLAMKLAQKRDTFLTCIALLSVASLVGLVVKMNGTGWNGVRYVIGGWVFLGCLIPLLEIRFAKWLLAAMGLVNCWYLLPHNVGSAELPALVIGALTAMPFLLLVAIIGAYLRRQGSTAPIILLAYPAIALWVCVAVPGIRTIYRYDIYASAGAGLSYANIPVTGTHALSMKSAKVWEALDGPENKTIAVAAGWDGKGHNWFIYPVFGSRLQNEISHVPIYKGLQSDPKADIIEWQSWFKELKVRRIEYVVSMAPIGPEAHWIVENPSHFQLVATGLDVRNFVVRVNPNADP